MSIGIKRVHDKTKHAQRMDNQTKNKLKNKKRKSPNYTLADGAMPSGHFTT